MDEKKKSKIKFIFSMIVFGTIGVVSHFIPLSSSAIVFYRALLATIFLLSATIIFKRKCDVVNLKKYFINLIFAGIFMGVNWVLQFEAFKISSVSIGTVCYNTMPIFVLILTPIMYKQKISFRAIICILVAMIGVIFVSNIFITGFKSTELLGALCGVCAAIFYALVVMIGKKIQLNSYDKVIIQFIVATLIMIPYIIIDKNSSFFFYDNIDSSTMILGLIMIIILGFFHTGFSYLVYFDSINLLKPEDIAIYTYIDPVVALILASIILKEKMNILQVIGAVLILGSTLFNEMVAIKHKTK